MLNKDDAEDTGNQTTEFFEQIRENQKAKDAAIAVEARSINTAFGRPQGSWERLQADKQNKGDR